VPEQHAYNISTNEPNVKMYMVQNPSGDEILSVDNNFAPPKINHFRFQKSSMYSRVINKTGGPSSLGDIVSVHRAVDRAVRKCVINEPDPIGVIAEAGIPDGEEMWIITGGEAYVYCINGSNRGDLVRGFVTGDSGYIIGKAKTEAIPSSPFATDKHFYEVGHARETRVGEGLVLCAVHFN